MFVQSNHPAYARKGNVEKVHEKSTKAPNEKKVKEDAVYVGAGLDMMPQGKNLVKPADQLELTDAELNEEITRILTTNNPHAPQNIVHYSFKEHCFKTTSVDQRVVHFVLEGSLLHKESDEAQNLRVKEDFPDENAAADAGTECDEDYTETVATPVEDGVEVEEVGEEDTSDNTTSKTGRKEQKLKNQFNFWGRATQTFKNPLTEKNCQTEPPPRSTFSATVQKWEMYDACLQEMERQEKNKERQKTKRENDKSKKNMETQSDGINAITKSIKIMERMVNLNTFDDIVQDFKYSDELRHQGDSLLPLWKFQYDKAKGLSVTALCWNRKYPDLFAVGMGSYGVIKQGHGLLVFYSLKNPAFPEYIYPTTSDILCLDIHEKHSRLVVVGFCDGSVAVYNLKEKRHEPVYKSTAKTGKHTDPVWQVRWQKDDMDNNHNFYSVSSDGRVVSWTLVKNELFFTDIMRLTMNGAVSEGPDGVQLRRIGCGVSFDFHKQIENLFLIGTEDGKIHKCSKTYSSQFLETYDAHTMPVDAVKWNPFHPKVFISCSSDWTVKIWDHTVKTPVLTFDLFAAVGDISCSPYSSTVFAAVTTDRAVHVFDLKINRNEAVTKQTLSTRKKTRLTCIEFNPVHPMIIVGDNRGTVSSLKLPPNLHKEPKSKSKKGQELPDNPDEEVAKMEKILSLLRGPEENNI